MTRAAIFLAIAMCSAVAGAQTFARDDFSGHRYYLAPGAGRYLGAEGADVSPSLQPWVAASLDYAHGPFVADDLACVTTPAPRCPHTETPLLGSLLDLQLAGAITLLDRVQIAVNLPFFLYYEGASYSWRETTPTGEVPRFLPGGSGAGLGDPRLHVKVHVASVSAGSVRLAFAAAAWLTAPVGHSIASGHFVGDRVPSFGGHAIAELSVGALRVALSVGGLYREEATSIRSAVGPELTYTGAISYRFVQLFSTLAEIAGSTSFGARFDSEAPQEIRVAGRLHVGDFTFDLGFGFGTIYGVGVPVARVLGGATWSPAADRDSDGDRVGDAVDACPSDAEDADEHDDEDGCPDEDNDEDGIADSDDPCPSEAEDIDEHEDQDGCPDADNDGDGIRDGYDSCPDSAEDMDGDRDTDGCADADGDGDGLEDPSDQCDDRAEDFDGYADADGCPEEDADDDGVRDERDRCPEQAEDRDGVRDRDGCPE